MAGQLATNDVLEVLASFEEQLPDEFLSLSLKRVPEIVAPSTPPELIQPFRLDRKRSPLRKETEKQLKRGVGGTIVRFASDLKVTRNEFDEIQIGQRYYDVHIAVQGPSIINHAEWTAFGILAKLLRRTIDELQSADGEDDFEFDDDFGNSNGTSMSDLLTFSSQDRKWPLAAFTLRGIQDYDLETCELRFHEVIQVKRQPRADDTCRC